jgi:hypothetical protein|nr:MAG TPA: hypothetical protein [Caudoviricetes sp.]
MPNAVKQRSVIYFKAPLKIDGKLVVAIHPQKLALVNEIHILACRKDNGEPYYPKPLYITGEDAVKYPLKPSVNNELVFLYEIPIADLKERLEGLDEVSGGVSDD